MNKEEYFKSHGLNQTLSEKFEIEEVEDINDGLCLRYPIKDQSGKVLFYKSRNFSFSKGGENSPPKFRNRGPATLYNSGVLKTRKSVVICEGEPDVWRLDQEDIPAVSSTSGAGTFKKEWSSLFNGKSIFICYDTDDAGVKGTRKLFKIFPEATAIILPLEFKDICDYLKEHTLEEFSKLPKLSKDKWELVYSDTKVSETETPSGVQYPTLIETPLAFQEVEQRVEKLLPNSSVALKIVLAVAISASFKNNVMLWMLLVGVPSSGKTDIVRLVKGNKSTYYLDTLTLNALISGERETETQKTHDLLPKLDKKCFVVKDWTSIFSLDERMSKKILGDLVGAYDKEFSKFSSRRGIVSYSSEFSHLGCVTPATLNRHTQYMNMVGPRFLFYTMPGLTEAQENDSFDEIFSNSDRKAVEEEARLYTSSYLEQLKSKDVAALKPLTKETQNYLKLAAKFMANSRGIAMLQASKFTGEDGNEVSYYEIQDHQIEQPWRAVQQLTGLVKYLAFVTGKDEVTYEELSIIKEIVLSSMPADRAQALKAVKELGGEITAKVLSDKSDKSHKTSLRLLDELTALKVIKKTRGLGVIPTNYRLDPYFKEFVLMDPKEFLSGTETPNSLYEDDSPPEMI